MVESTPETKSILLRKQPNMSESILHLEKWNQSYTTHALFYNTKVLLTFFFVSYFFFILLISSIFFLTSPAQITGSLFLSFYICVVIFIYLLDHTFCILCFVVFIHCSFNIYDLVVMYS